jgi:hypothetical protein
MDCLITRLLSERIEFNPTMVWGLQIATNQYIRFHDSASKGMSRSSSGKKAMVECMP